jgi:hypothetical protein
MPVIPALGKLRQEDCEFQASLNYIARLCQKGRKEAREGGREVDSFNKSRLKGIHMKFSFIQRP